MPVFRQLFEERGLPDAIRSDNGVPFASPKGLYNLSCLSVWWLRLGLAIERIKPGCPQQNGRHEGVTHALGTFCYLCLRAGQKGAGAGDGIRTHDFNLGKVALYP